MQPRRRLPVWPLAHAEETPENARLASQVRALRREILDRMQRGAEPNRNVIMVTSCLGGEGKSFVAAHLALSLSAERNIATTLVDADSVRRTVTRSCEAEKLKGFTDLLLDEKLAIEDVLLDTGVRGLSVMGAGRYDSAATEAISSARANRLFEQMSGMAGSHVFIFDCSSLLATGESLAMTRRAGQILVVVRSGATPVPALSELLQRLDGKLNVSIVLNGYTRTFLDNYYDYYQIPAAD